MQKAIAMPWQGDALASLPGVEVVTVGKIRRVIETSDVCGEPLCPGVQRTVAVCIY